MGHVCRWPRTLRNAKKKWLRPRCATRKGWSGATLEPLPGWAYPDRRSNQRSGSWESTGTASNPCEFLYPQSLNLSRLQGNGSFKVCPFDLLIEILRQQDGASNAPKAAEHLLECRKVEENR